MTKAIVSIFQNGRNQAVRIPRDMEFSGVSELIATREGDTLTLRPARPSWDDLAALQPIENDFLGNRPDVIELGRVDFIGNKE
ncbi:MAG: type II toxin-antitoxin system VapB family antitoxin [Polyangiaceae bacterium]|nr:type II toxin-antitoxin system VapB family antitoxin [Polyangiaceae bacterium]